LWPSIACWIATPAATASAAPGKVAMIPSPVFFVRKVSLFDTFGEQNRKTDPDWPGSYGKNPMISGLFAETDT
jgi:hypothetical protein